MNLSEAFCLGLAAGTILLGLPLGVGLGRFRRQPAPRALIVTGDVPESAVRTNFGRELRLRGSR